MRTTVRRRRARKAATAGVLVAALGSAAVAARGLGLADSRGDDHAAVATPTATAKVTKGTLVDTQKVAGQLGYGEAKNVLGKLGGTVTGLPAAGSVLHRGQVVYRADDKPIILLYGSLPAYRALSVGMKGADVLQFEQNLAALGYDGFTVDTKFSAATAKAVKQWQHDLGLDKTGTVELGRAIYAPGPIRVDTVKVSVGDNAQGGALLTYTGTARVVTADLELSDRRLVRVGAAVRVVLPDGKEIPGKVVGAATVVVTGQGGDNSGSDDSTTKLRVTVALGNKAAVGLEAATADVEFAASARVGVLTVPVAALLALAEGGYGVEVISGSTSRIVAVRTGMFADGRVEVTGQGLAAGMTVGVPS
ncbi:peptidoglycan-binding protein [Kribbella sp. NPDC026611]|uniref:peptidoglycan-binding protein n=1 Tax=Kribbella sp. NPDC026611 TaxID=3154911 RepID=UPI0033D64522